MRVASRLAGNRTQTEPLRRIEARALDPTVIQRETLRLAVFEVQLAVIHSGQRLTDERLDPDRVHAGAFEEQRVGDGEIGHWRLHRRYASIWSQAVLSGRRQCRPSTTRPQRPSARAAACRNELGQG